MRQYALAALAFMLSLTWVFLAGDLYSYNFNFPSIFGLNMYPLVLWTVGLFAFYNLNLLIWGKLGINNPWKKALFYSVLYWILIIIAETVGYHVFGVHDTATEGYPGLPICDCMHAPTWMKTVYFLMGIIYLGLIKAIERILPYPS